MTHAGNSNVGLRATRNLVKAHALKIRIRHYEGATFERLGLPAILCDEFRRFLCGINAEYVFEQYQSANDAYDGRRVRHSIGKRGQRSGDLAKCPEAYSGLRSGAERGCIGRSARENAQHGRSIESSDPPD
jgi:hypothetical protein